MVAEDVFGLVSIIFDDSIIGWPFECKFKF